MTMRLTTYDLKDALAHGSVIPYRVVLAFAASLFSVITWLDVLFPAAVAEYSGQSYVLASGWAYGWAMIFGTDALALWWRLVDDSTDKHRRKVVWAVGINVVTFALWGTMTVASAMTGPVLAPGITGYVVLTLMALHALWRTQFTWRDRVTL